MKLSLFRSGLAPRLLVAAAFGALAFGAVIGMSRTSAVRAAASVAPTAAARAPIATLCIESLQPVDEWTVRIDGTSVAPRATSATLWIGEAALGSDASLVVDAVPAENAATSRNALRIRIAGTQPARDHVVWCERDWTVAAHLTDLARSPGPIEMEDLP